MPQQLTIDGFRKIVVEQPLLEIWRDLRYFLDVANVANRVRTAQNVPAGKHEKHLQKHARQIAYSIRQAEEYFRAASQVTLATKPTLMYYGAVSLTRAMVLFRNTGEYSIDFLRQSDRHNHHGLNLSKKFSVLNPSKTGVGAFFESLECSVNMKALSQEQRATSPQFNEAEPPCQEPWGHFPLVYNSLLPAGVALPAEIFERGRDDRSGHMTGQFIGAVADIIPFTDVMSRPLKCLDLMKTMPDMFDRLSQLDIAPNLCPGRATIELTRIFKRDSDGTYSEAESTTEYRFYVDGIPEDVKAPLLQFYKEKNPNIVISEDRGEHLTLDLKVNRKTDESHRPGYLPDLVDDVFGQLYWILDPTSYLPECASMLTVLYCLSMLSRYNPDIWMAAVDSNIQIKELTDSFLGVVERKLPNLVLDQITLTKNRFVVS